jgi:hypothetical protein
MNYKLFFIVAIFLSGTCVSSIDAEIQTAPQGVVTSSERIMGVKFLDAYFGTATTKMEVAPGDKNVPLTVTLANIGTNDIVGIKGQLFLPMGFSSPNGTYKPMYADTNEKALAGANFQLTFFVNISPQADIKTYPATVELDYSRIRESGLHHDAFNFDFRLTGESVINLKAVTPFITSITNNNVVLEISNPGSSSLSNIDIVLQNTSTTTSSTTTSTTNVEKVIFDQNQWKIGNIGPNSSKIFSFNVFVPESLKNEPLRIPLGITYSDAHGEQKSVTRVADLYINGLVNPSIYGVKVIEMSGKKTIIGEILNEGNSDGLFGFVKLQPLGDSNIKESSQYIDEIEPDSPVPFNIPIESNGILSFGEHDIRILVSYKDSVRDEHILTYDTTITIKPFDDNTDYGSMIGGLIFLAFVIAVAYKLYSKNKIPFIKKGQIPFIHKKTDS